MKLKQLLCRHKYYVYSRYIGSHLVTFHECTICGKIKANN